MIKTTCGDCGKEIFIKYDTYRTTKNRDTHIWRCNECLYKYRSNLKKKQEAELSEEERERRNRLRSMSLKKYNAEHMTKEDWDNRVAKAKDTIAKRPKEVTDDINRRISETLKEFFENESEDDKRLRSDNMKKSWANMPDERKKEISNIHKQVYENYSIDKLEEISRSKKETWKNMDKFKKKEIADKILTANMSKSDEEKEFIKQKKQETWANKSPEEIQESINKRNKTISNYSEERKKEIIENATKWFKELSPEEQAEHIRRLLNRSHGLNSLSKKFEEYFKNSVISNYFSIEHEYITMNNDVIHHWDYAIINQNGDVEMVVDIDGKFFHADECDYDGLHSKEEYDEKRFISIPNGIKGCIIYEYDFTKSFEKMIKDLMINYDEFIINQFRMCRLMPFPYPEYSDKELITSFEYLKRMKCDDKYHKDISLNTRIGDHLIYHFHKSIYHSHRKNKMSPYDAWYDDDLLMKVIKNRIIYVNTLNRNKILQGFNISKIAQKVSVFSAGRAKLLIYKYLNEYDEIFDPFSGFSGRMLGTVSLGKKYIGQDLSEIHIFESNKLIEFLYRYFNFDANILCKDVLKSSGIYECLFTCPPYNDIEIWEDVNPINKSCDEWIDICLNNFKCKRYLFVVDNTEKYKDFIVDEIINKSHMNQNKEYVIMIDENANVE